MDLSISCIATVLKNSFIDISFRSQYFFINCFSLLLSLSSTLSSKIESSFFLKINLINLIYYSLSSSIDIYLKLFYLKGSLKTTFNSVVILKYLTLHIYYIGNNIITNFYHIYIFCLYKYSFCIFKYL